MQASFRMAAEQDIAGLLPLARDFCIFERMSFDPVQRTDLLMQLITEPRNGRLVVIADGREFAGYYVLGFNFSIEFGGVNAILDELYVRPEYRNQGLGTAALEHAFALCRSLGISCLHLEADYFNERAHALYLRHGFKDHERHLMTKWLRT